MGRRPGKRRDVRSPLQAIFLKRVKEEMERQQLSGNQLSKRVGAPPQRTIAAVLLGADPRLETVHQIAAGLGLPAVSLLTESKGNVYQLPGYPPIQHGEKSHKHPLERKSKRA